MTQKEKQLLLQDLCARLPYGVKVCIMLPNNREKIFEPNIGDLEEITKFGGYLVNSKGIDYRSFNLDIKPYLRPMSSMTEEEKKEFESFHCIYEHHPYFYQQMCNLSNETNMFDWLNKKMFDYRGLIPKGLASEALEGMYNI